MPLWSPPVELENVGSMENTGPWCRTRDVISALRQKLHC